jgi:hypothetical protein
MSWRLRLSVETILRLTPAVLGSTVFSIAGLCAAHACLDDQALLAAREANRLQLADARLGLREDEQAGPQVLEPVGQSGPVHLGDLLAGPELGEDAEHAAHPVAEEHPGNQLEDLDAGQDSQVASRRGERYVGP